MNSFDISFNETFSFLRNDYLAPAMLLILTAYLSRAIPKLSIRVLKIFENIIVQFLIFFLIIYLAMGRPTIALFTSITAIAILQALKYLDLLENHGETPNEAFYNLNNRFQ